MQWQIPDNPFAELLVSADTRDGDYHLLLDAVAGVCDRFSLTWAPKRPRGTEDFSQRSVELAKQMAPFQLHEERVLEWPPTIIIGNIPLGERPLLRIFQSTPPAIAILKRTRPSLIHWLGPEFPQDPCFYLSNGDCCLVTCAHENGAVVYVPHDSSLVAALEPLVSKGLLSPSSFKT